MIDFSKPFLVKLLVAHLEPQLSQTLPFYIQFKNMQNQRLHPRFSSIICWKCGAENNLSASKSCLKCGINLELFLNKGLKFKNKKPSIFGAILKVTLLISALLILSGIFSIRFIAPHYPEIAAYKPLAYISGTTSNGSATIYLPANSWYKDNPWNHIKYYPTVGEILSKNNEAIGNSITPEMLKTVSISGKFSVGGGGCSTVECAKNRDKANGILMAELPENLKKYNNVYALNDMAEQQIYNDLGSIQAFIKKPDKLLRTTKANIPNDGYKLNEVIEGFNSTNGWKYTKDVTNQGQVFETTIALDPLDGEKLKADLAAMWQVTLINDSSIKFKDIEKVNDRVAFVLTRDKGNKKIETIYFDSISGQVIKIDSDGNSVYFAEFKPFNGINLPSAIYSRRVEAGRVIWLRVNQIEWKFNEELDDAIFEKPVQNQINSATTRTP